MAVNFTSTRHSNFSIIAKSDPQFDAIVCTNAYLCVIGTVDCRYSYTERGMGSISRWARAARERDEEGAFGSAGRS